MPRRLQLSRAQILGFRRAAGGLDQRLPLGAASFRRAAWAGLQDSVPRAALLSLHARVAEVAPDCWQHSSLVQIWGPRFNAYVVAARDLAIFTLGRLSENARARTRASGTAERLAAALKGRRLPFGEAGRSMGVPPNSLRYAAPTGSVLIHWDGARQPLIWTVPPPEMDVGQARLEMARRYLHVFGPGTTASYAHWAGIRSSDASATLATLAGELTPVFTPIGEAWILTEDESAFRKSSRLSAPARLLPSGDAFYLLWGVDRELLVPDAKLRAQLWTTRVWPGALLIRGEVSGVWSRSAGEIAIQPWRPLSAAEVRSVESEASALPLPGLTSSIQLKWNFG